MGRRGAPTKYKKCYCKKIIEYFSRKPNQLNTADGETIPLFEDFASLINVHTDTLQEWKKVHPEFSVAYQKAKELQKAHWIHGSMAAKFNPAFTIFFGKNIFKWTDKQNIELQGDLSINLINYGDTKPGNNDTI